MREQIHVYIHTYSEGRERWVCIAASAVSADLVPAWKHNPSWLFKIDTHIQWLQSHCGYCKSFSAQTTFIWVLAFSWISAAWKSFLTRVLTTLLICLNKLKRKENKGSWTIQRRQGSLTVGSRALRTRRILICLSCCFSPWPPRAFVNMPSLWSAKPHLENLMLCLCWNFLDKNIRRKCWGSDFSVNLIFQHICFLCCVSPLPCSVWYAAMLSKWGAVLPATYLRLKGCSNWQALWSIFAAEQQPEV